MSVKPWIVLESRRLLANEWLSVRVDKCKIPDRKVTIDDFYVIERRDSAYIVPVTQDNRVVLVKQYRHASGKILFEVPAGYINARETPQEAAERELLEETGFIAKSIDYLGMFYASPAVLTNKAYIFLCRNLKERQEPARDVSEDIELAFFNIKDLVAVGIPDQLLLDAVSVSAILLAYHRMEGK